MYSHLISYFRVVVLIGFLFLSFVSLDMDAMACDVSQVLVFCFYCVVMYEFVSPSYPKTFVFGIAG